MLTHRHPALLTALALCLSLGVTACGGDDGAESEETGAPTTSITGPGVDPSANFTTADQFLQALAANTEAELAGAKSLVAPKSAAARYLAEAQAGLSPSASPLTLTEVSAGTYRLCDGTACTVISGLVLADGKISSFKVDGKQTR